MGTEEGGRTLHGSQLPWASGWGSIWIHVFQWPPDHLHHNTWVIGKSTDSWIPPLAKCVPGE